MTPKGDPYQLDRLPGSPQHHCHMLTIAVRRRQTDVPSVPRLDRPYRSGLPATP